MIATTIDVVDPALDHFLTQLAIEEFQTQQLATNIMQLIGVFKGKIPVKRFSRNLTFILLELTAPAVNYIWTDRIPMDHNLVSERIYDEDYNLITSESPIAGTTRLYKLSQRSMEAVPCSRLERLMMVLSTTPHQSILIMHLHLQGIFNRI